MIIDNSKLKVGDHIVITKKHGGNYVGATGIIIKIPPDEYGETYMTIYWKPLTAKIDYILHHTPYWITSGLIKGTENEVLFMKIVTTNTLGNFPRREEEVRE